MTRYVFTSANLAYGEKVAALSESIKRHEPAVRFVWALVERPDQSAKAPESVDEVLRLDDLDRDWTSHLAGRPIVEACTAVKAAVLKHLLNREDCTAVVYMDPDIYVYSPLDPVWQALESSPIVLTPHLLAPSVTDEGIRDNEISAMKHGIYNLGFIAVSCTEVGLAFAEWWDVRLWDYCLDAPERGLFTDQRWIDHVPVFFPSVHILRHQGCNVASWNLGERDIEERDGRILVNGDDLVFWHFSSVDNQAHLDMIGKYGRGGVPERISEQYRTALGSYVDEYSVRGSWSLAPATDPVSRARRMGWRVGRGLVRGLAAGPAGPTLRSLVPKALRDQLRERVNRVE